MQVVLWLIFVGLVLIDGKLWKLVIEQGRSNRAVESLLREIRDRDGRIE